MIAGAEGKFMPDELNQKRPRFQRIRNAFRWARSNWKPLAIVGAWVVSTWLMILLYDVLRASPARITETQVKDYVASAMASATPPPAIASQVFAAVHPSMVFIQTKVITTTEGKVEGTRGSGVVIDDSGSILTSLHVVDKAIDIQVTFADGTQSAHSFFSEIQRGSCLAPSAQPPDGVLPAVLGSSGSLSIGDEVLPSAVPLGSQTRSVPASCLV
jgi:S1-C subfamily serine protease